MRQRSKRTCEKGHTYYKSSTCPTCPVCEADKKPTGGFLSLFAAPARRALDGAGILTAKDLAHFSEQEIKILHGIGPRAISIIKTEMEKENLTFRKH